MRNNLSYTAKINFMSFSLDCQLFLEDERLIKLDLGWHL